MYRIVVPTELGPVRSCPLVSVPAVGHSRLPGLCITLDGLLVDNRVVAGISEKTKPSERV